MPQKEVVKRKNPSPQVKRELFVKSGNQCAFPGCSLPIINEKGDYVAQICHIEAAEENGERFNPNSSNEERAKFENLMLMCYPHHVETNNVKVYTVDKMRDMKSTHEAKFSDVANIIIDASSKNTLSLPKNALLLIEETQQKVWDNDNLEELCKCLDSLSTLTEETLSILAIILEHATGKRHECPLSELEIHTKKSKDYLMMHTDILEKKEFLYLDDTEVNAPKFVIYDSCYLHDIKKFSERSGVALSKLLVNLDFTILDKK